MRITKKQVLAFIFLTAFSLMSIISLLPARADETLINSQTGLTDVGQMAYGQKTPQDIRMIVAKIVNIVLGFLGAIFLALTVFAGFKYMTSGGNEEKAKEAVSLLRNAIIGLVIILAAWLITRFSIQILRKTVNNAVDYNTYYPYGN